MSNIGTRIAQPVEDGSGNAKFAISAPIADRIQPLLTDFWRSTHVLDIAKISSGGIMSEKVR